MPSEVKLLYGGIPSTTRTDVYTVPDKKYAIARSIVITSRSTAAQSYVLFIGNVSLGNTYTVPPGKSIVIDDLSIPLLPGQVISVQNVSANGVGMWISGEELDYSPSDYPYASSYGLIQTSYSPLINLDPNNDWMLKSLVLNNTAFSDNRSIILSLISPTGASHHLLFGYSIKVKNVLVLPLPNIIIPKGYTIRAYVEGTVTDVWYGITCMKVNT